ncbi:MAG: MerR family transcriptional regulator [Candidatus Dormibacteria bacterium]|jgi:MerR family transcriptional regulator/heat shock protein HspR
MALETLTPTTHRMLDLDKPLYTISVAAEILASHPRTLMMYESMGLGVPARTATNRRRYTQRDILTLTAIQRLTRQHGLNIAGARYVIKCLQLLDAHGIPRPSELTDIDLEHVRI